MTRLHGRALHRFAPPILLVAGLAASACTPTPDGSGPRDKRALAAKTNEKLGRNKRAQSFFVGRVMSPYSGVRTPRADSLRSIPLAKTPGHIMKGTDALLFRRCGESVSYFILTSGQVSARIAQKYKFAVPRPYAPLYAVLTARFFSDTITVGANTYQRIAEVASMALDDDTAPACGAPTRESIAAELASH